MPFSKTKSNRTKKYWDGFFELIKNILDELGYEAFRSGDKPQSLTKAILQNLALTDIVLAVLTDDNPNVWYELGVRNSQRRGTIMAIQKRQKLSFDIDDYGVIHYSISSRQGINDLKTKIDSYLNKLKKNINDSPVSDFLNISLQDALNIAVGRLRESIQLIEDSYTKGMKKEEIRQKANEYQRSLGRNINGQISIIENKKIILHETKQFEGQGFDGRWLEKGRSVVYDLWSKKTGVRFTQLDLHPDRVSILAFDIFKEFQWLIIAEGHYQQHYTRPF